MDEMPAVLKTSQYEPEDIEAKAAFEYERYAAEVEKTNDAEAASAKALDLNQLFNTYAGGAEYESMLLSYQLKQLFYTQDWVYILVNLIASKISAQPLRVVSKTVKEGKIIVQQAEGHPLQDRIDDPNPVQDYATFMYCLVADECITGNSITWKADALQQLIPLPSELVRLDIDRVGRLSRYMVQSAGDMLSGLQGLPLAVIPAEQIIHTRRPNPSAMLWGLSPLIPASKAVDFNRYTSDYLNGFYERGATPQMVLSMEKDANEKVALRLLRSFEAAYAGKRNSRRTLVTPKGVTADQMSHTIADQNLIDLVGVNRETLLNIWQVPKHELSLAEAGSLGSEEAKQALKNFWAACLKPIMARIAGKMTKAFANELGQGFALEFDLSDVEVLREDELRKAELAKLMLATHSPNEVRAKLYDDPPIAGGEALQQPTTGAFGGGIFGGAGSAGHLTPDAGDGQAEGKAITVDAKAGEGVQTTDIGKAESQEAENREAGVTDAKKAFAAKIKAEGGWFQKRQQKFDAAIDPHVDGMKKIALRNFKDVAAAAAKVVSSHLKAKDYRPARTKADGDPPGPKAVIPSKAELRKALRKAYSDLEEKWTDESVKYLEGSADLGYDIQLDVPFKLPDDVSLEALKTEGESQRRAILEDRELRTFAWMSETDTEKIMGLVEDGVQKGLTIQKVAESIQDNFGDVEDIGNRALVIARTETLTAASIGQAAAANDLATVVPDMEKVWIATHDNRTRDSHADLDGDQIPMDQKFANGLEYPRDPNGEASEVIQCRCAVIYVPKGFEP